ncbi:MAG: IS110 family transposase [Campylobacterota bacterium]|nr:IS110 family transposase [Campylobacterota bacterium]MEA3501101.1 IS110 family transposase [Candidatus Neomarinimicrobiota bacterium]
MNIYIGIDMAKYDFMCAVESEDKSIQFVHPKLANTTRGFDKLKQWITKIVPKQKVGSIHIGVESTGGYETPLVEWVRIHTDFLITVINPSQVKYFGKTKLIRTKTDKVDARLIACYMATYNPEPTPVPPRGVKGLKSLTRHLEHLKSKRASEKTYIQNVQNSQIKTMIKQTIRSYDRQIEKVEQHINEHFDKYPDLKSNRNLLISITSIGSVTAATMLSELNGSLIPKQQVAHAGLAPRERQSGQYKGKAKLCKAGNRRIRTALYLPTLSAIQHNPIIAPFYKKLISRGKLKMVAVCACMRKLLHIIVGVLKNQIPFDPNFNDLSLAS